MNPYYNYSGAFIPGTLARAETETAEFQSVQQGFNLLSNSGLDTGVVNALVVTTPYAPTALVDGATVVVKVKLANTAAATLAANGLPATNILRGNGAALQIGDLTANVWTTFTYDSSFAAWLLSAPAAFTATSGVTVIASGPPVNKVGLVAAAGVSLQVVPIDATYAIDQSIAPTWTGDHIFAPASGRAVTINAASNNYGTLVNGNSTTGQSYGLQIQAGTNSTDVAFWVLNQAGTVGFLQVVGDGHGYLRPTAATGLSWTAAGVYTLSAPNAGSTLLINATGAGDSALALSSPSGGADGRCIIDFQALKTTTKEYTIGIDAQGGVVKSFDIRDITRGAVPFSISTNGVVSIAAPSAGNALSVTGLANQYVAFFISGNVAGQDFGIQIQAGSTAADSAFNVVNRANTVTFLNLKGDGSGTIGPSASLGLSWSSGGNVSIATPSSGCPLAVNGLTGTQSIQAGLFIGGTNNPRFYVTHTEASGLTDIAFTGSTGYNGSISIGITQVMTFSNAGNVVVKTPSSGVALVANGVNGTDAMELGSAGAAGLLRFGWNTVAQANAWNIVTQSTDPLALGTSGAAAFQIFTNSAGRLAVNSSGNVTISAPGSGQALAVTGLANQYAAFFLSGNTSGQDFGVQIQAGSTSADSAFNVVNRASTTTFLNLSGDGSGQIGPKVTWASTGAVTVSAPSSGNTVTSNATGAGDNAFVLVAPSGGADGRCTIDFQALKTTTKEYTIGIDTQGGVTKSFDIRDITAGTVRFSVATGGTISSFGPNAAALVDLTPDSGTYTGTLTGCTTAPTCTITWRRTGNVVVLNIGAVTAISNAVTCTITGAMPSSIQPTALDQWCPLFVNDNGALPVSGYAKITHASSTITLLRGDAASFQTVGQKGMQFSTTICYAIA